MHDLLPRLALAIFLLSTGMAQAQTLTLCTLVTDADSGAVLVERGDCDNRVTPASTFKIAIALMGFDSGFLENAHSPTLRIRKGEPDWGGDAWSVTDPTYWLEQSVVWYSQRVTAFLGRAPIERYLRDFAYGNLDFSGDPGKDNGLQRAWISSSLRISPREQTAFLKRMLKGKLPVSRHALQSTLAIVESAPVAGGWTVHGKTGSAYPRRKDGKLDRTRGWGWFVGWASSGGRTVVFAHLTQDDRRHEVTGGIRAKQAFVAGFPKLLAEVPPRR